MPKNILFDMSNMEHSENIKSSEGDCTEHTNHSIEERMQEPTGPIRFCHCTEDKITELGFIINHN